MKYILRFSYILCGLWLLQSCAKEEIPDHAEFIEATGTIPHETENLIIVTLDGFRWQEVFNGADSTLLFNDKFVPPNKQEELKEVFWANTPEERREKLLPFFWKTLSEEGQIYGNRKYGNKVNVANPYWTSYAGYHEIFTGYVNLDVNSNEYGNSPDYNILEFFKENVKEKETAIVGRWSFYERVFNVERSGLSIVTGTTTDFMEAYVNDVVNAGVKQRIESLNLFSKNTHLDDDKTVLSAAFNYLETNKPNVFYIGLGATDKLGHLSKYGNYLEAAYNTSIVLQELWNYIQSTSQYKDKTTMFISVDHGRGEGEEWVNHSRNYRHSDETWFAVIGPDTSAKGEIKDEQQFYNQQFAKTFAALMGYRVKGIKWMAEPVKEVME